MKSLCIIPARGGSKRIPRKNILPLNGIPLISYTIRAAIKAKVFSDIVVSSEDKEIQEIALREGVLIDHRPEAMAGDTVTKVEVVKEYIERKKAVDKYDYVAALLPTCPFRTHEDIQNAYNLLVNQREQQFLIGTTKYEFPIQLALQKEGENVMRMVSEENYQTTRSQDIAERYHPNGAIYLATTKAFMEQGTFFNKRMLSYNMPAERSFDIDYPYQFEIAEIMAKRLVNEL